jgi:ribonuclease HII
MSLCLSKLAPLAVSLSLLHFTKVHALIKSNPVRFCRWNSLYIPPFSSLGPTISTSAGLFAFVVGSHNTCTSGTQINARIMTKSTVTSQSQIIRRSRRIQMNQGYHGDDNGTTPNGPKKNGRKRPSSTRLNTTNIDPLTTSKKKSRSWSKGNLSTQKRGAATSVTTISKPTTKVGIALNIEDDTTTKSTAPERSLTTSSQDPSPKVTENLGKNEYRCESLPRTRERQLQQAFQLQEDPPSPQPLCVVGVDEAGRGPLAGPVVAAAILLPLSLDTIPGVVDSKKVTKEEDREAVYNDIITLPHVRWAVSVIDAARIDEINILQATLQGMKMAVEAVMKPPPMDYKFRFLEASIEHTGCYVVCSKDVSNISDTVTNGADCTLLASITGSTPPLYHVLIDGNRLPKDMPCEAEFIVKGDSKECCIAAASILAKVTRDRLMHGYDKLYPQYNLAQHKGYPTAAHMAAVQKHGASAIHRRTFAPLKHMNLDENGKIVALPISEPISKEIDESVRAGKKGGRKKKS